MPSSTALHGQISTPAYLAAPSGFSGPKWTVMGGLPAIHGFQKKSQPKPKGKRIFPTSRAGPAIYAGRGSVFGGNLWGGQMRGRIVASKVIWFTLRNQLSIKHNVIAEHQGVEFSSISDLGAEPTVFAPLPATAVGATQLVPLASGPGLSPRYSFGLWVVTLVYRNGASCFEVNATMCMCGFHSYGCIIAQ